jgi:hypothetical protein
MHTPEIGATVRLMPVLYCDEGSPQWARTTLVEQNRAKSDYPRRSSQLRCPSTDDTEAESKSQHKETIHGHDARCTSDPWNKRERPHRGNPTLALSWVTGPSPDDTGECVRRTRVLSSDHRWETPLSGRSLSNPARRDLPLWRRGHTSSPSYIMSMYIVGNEG